MSPAVVTAGAPKAAAAPTPADDDATLIAALARREPSAPTRLVHRYGPLVERLVAGALGVDIDVADVVQEVFVRILERVHQLRDPAALRGWIGSVAVFTARGHIRRRRRWRWIRFFAPADVPDRPCAPADSEGGEVLRATYRALDALPVDERLAFTLRFVAEMELVEVARACEVSLATVKRRLARAELAFRARAESEPLLRDRLERSRRWGGR